jgi:hypothetical protein
MVQNSGEAPSDLLADAARRAEDAGVTATVMQPPT